jgi:ABC-2 type transport system ATP-binding protein
MIHFEGVSKQYGSVSALTGLNLHIHAGITGLLGPNGAGKSTTLKLVVGYLGPSTGRVRVCGSDPRRATTRVHVGYLPEGAPLPPDATVLEILNFTAQIRIKNREERRHAIDRVVQRLDLGVMRDRLADTLSKGQRRRVALAAAVLGNPKVLVLDEPTDGLDPNQRDEVHALIRELAPDRAVLISTHILDEAERLCDRAVIITAGRLVADDAPGELARRARHHDAVRLEWSGDPDIAAMVQRIRELPTVMDVELDAEHRALTAIAQPGARPFGDVAALAARHEWPIEVLRHETGQLEDVFRTLTSAGAVG